MSAGRDDIDQPIIRNEGGNMLKDRLRQALTDRARTGSMTTYRESFRAIRRDRKRGRSTPASFSGCFHSMEPCARIPKQRPKEAGDHELLRAAGSRGFHRVVRLHRTSLHERDRRRFAPRGGLSSLPRSRLPLFLIEFARAYALSVYKSPKLADMRESAAGRRPSWMSNWTCT
jgi:hypothetical protein